MLTCPNELGATTASTSTVTRPNINLDLNVICSPFEVAKQTQYHQRALVLPAGHEIQSYSDNDNHKDNRRTRWRAKPYWSPRHFSVWLTVNHLLVQRIFRLKLLAAKPVLKRATMVQTSDLCCCVSKKLRKASLCCWYQVKQLSILRRRASHTPAETKTLARILPMARMLEGVLVFRRRGCVGAGP